MNITAGKFKGQKITSPDESVVRPTLSKVRMAVFNTLQAMIDFDGASFLDMYAGSGIMGLEAFSRGFQKIIAIEKNPKVLKILKDNYAQLGIVPNIIRGDSLKSVPNQYYDVVYIDPPYFAGIYEKSLEVLPNCEIVILEHVCEVDFGCFELIKQKKYGDKIISFLKRKAKP